MPKQPPKPAPFSTKAFLPNADAHFRLWWDARCRKGDPARMPNPARAGFDAGYAAAFADVRALDDGSIVLLAPCPFDADNCKITPDESCPVCGQDSDGKGGTCVNTATRSALASRLASRLAKLEAE